MDAFYITIYAMLAFFVGCLMLFPFWAIAGFIKPLRKFYCNTIGWHCWPSQIQWIYNDGCSNHCICAWCGRECMQDSQGNIF